MLGLVTSLLLSALYSNNFLMQFQSDVLGVTIVRPKLLDTTAVGAALLAGLGCGMWPSITAIKTALRADCTFEPTMSPKTVDGYLDRWQRAVGIA